MNTTKIDKFGVTKGRRSLSNIINLDFIPIENEEPLQPSTRGTMWSD